jgi:hypothetical protein
MTFFAKNLVRQYYHVVMAALRDVGIFANVIVIQFLHFKL